MKANKVIIKKLVHEKHGRHENKSKTHCTFYSLSRFSFVFFRAFRGQRFLRSLPYHPCLCGHPRFGIRLDYDNYGKVGQEFETGRAKIEALSANVLFRF